MPAYPRRGSVSVHISAEVEVGAAAIRSSSASFVSRVRIFGMLQVPQGAATLDHRERCEVVLRWWRGRGPFERPRIPGIVAGGFTGAERSHNVNHEYEHRDALYERTERCNQVKSL